MSSYIFPCDELGLVLRIKNLPEHQEHKLFAEVRGMFKNKKHLNLDSYKKVIVTTLIEDVVNLLEPFEEEIKSNVVDSMFSVITEAYPYLDIGYVCGNVNLEEYITLRSGGDGIPNIDSLLKISRASPDLLFSNSINEGIGLSSLEEIKQLEAFLNENIIGQESAIDAVIKNLKLIAAGFSSRSSMFFVGPTGVGKTELSKLLGKKYSGNFYKINCAEYAGSHEYAKLIGSPPGYIGHSEESILGEKAKISNEWVLLFDEIEKAHPKLRDFLLSILDDGTCTDNLGNTLDFSKSILIFTSNQGVSEIKQSKVGFSEDAPSIKETREVLDNSIKRDFSPEFLNRVDDLVFFDPLGKKEIEVIVNKELEDLPINVSKELVDFVVEGGYSSEYGARNIKRFIKKNVTTVLSEDILNKKAPRKKNDLYTVKIKDGKLYTVNTIRRKDKNESPKSPSKVRSKTTRPS